MREQFRGYYSHALDVNIWGEDCPYVCDLCKRWSRCVGEEA